MKSIPRLAIGLFGGLLFGQALLAGDVRFGPALGTFPMHYSHWKMPWWSDVDQGWDGPWMVRPNIKRDWKLDDRPYARPGSFVVDLTANSSTGSPELSQGFFRPSL